LFAQRVDIALMALPRAFHVFQPYTADIVLLVVTVTVLGYGF